MFIKENLPSPAGSPSTGSSERALSEYFYATTTSFFLAASYLFVLNIAMAAANSSALAVFCCTCSFYHLSSLYKVVYIWFQQHLTTYRFISTNT